MIKSLSVAAEAKTPVSWWYQVFPKAQTWKFEPGINILWGPNGSGKSTVLRLLARLHHCEQTGQTLVTENSLRELCGGKLPITAPTGVKVQHDGQELRYFNPETVVGKDQYGGFNWDAGGSAALEAFMVKGSTGQLNRHRFIKVLEPQRDSKIQWNYTAKRLRKGAGGWGKVTAWAEHYLKGTLEKRGTVTILLDEPDAGLDWPNRQDLWEFLNLTADRCQWIIASHSIFAMNHPTAHYLDLETGYREKCRKVFSQVATVQEKA